MAKKINVATIRWEAVAMAVGTASCLNKAHAMFMSAFNVKMESSEKVLSLGTDALDKQVERLGDWRGEMRV